ncbi:MAG: phosphotyrosine protein phosphatase [Rhizobiaceae bacterium]
MKRVLFICGKGRQRNPTAEQVFASVPDWETDSAGLGADADIPVSAELLQWATHIAVMEKRQIARLRRAFPGLASGRRLVSLDIADDYAFMQPELVLLLHERAGRIV